MPSKGVDMIEARRKAALVKMGKGVERAGQSTRAVGMSQFSGGKTLKKNPENDLSTSHYTGEDLEKLGLLMTERKKLVKKIRRVTTLMRQKMLKNASINGNWYKLFKSYDRDNSGNISFAELAYVVYKELDISELPPGEVLQTSWNGDLIFVRRLTKSEVDQTNALPASTQLDKESKTAISDAGNSSVVCCSAICTHLGCIPVPYLGAYKGWVCLCHGSVYDKFGRVRQGPATGNLPPINNQVHGETLCIEEMKLPNEPSIYLYV